MLDKSIPFKSIIMTRTAQTPFEVKALPQGFRLVPYQQGDEQQWAKIKTSVLEFDNEQDALARFQNQFLAYPKESERRVLFLENSKGEKIGTISAWWKYSNQKRIASLSWVSIKPEYQGQGLGYPMISQGVQHIIDIEGDVDMILGTQTWSHKAIKLYQQIGFVFDFLHTPNNPHTEKKLINESQEGLELLQELKIL